jgi:predicted MFS family arabinose efflux permease
VASAPYLHRNGRCTKVVDITLEEAMTTTLLRRSDTVPYDQRALHRNRAAIAAAFGILGTAIGTWTARIPAIQHQLDLSNSKLSVALLALAVGGLVGMRAAGRLVDRHGAGRVIIMTSLVLGALLTVTAYAPSLLVLVLALMSFGIVHGTLNIAANAAAVACQNAYQRPIMASFHALFSIGGACGAAAGAAAAHFHLDAVATFAGVGIVLTLTAVGASRWITPTATATSASQQPTHAGIPSQLRRRVLVLGALAFCCLIGEGAAADWSSVYSDQIGASPSAAEAAFTALAALMTIGRLTGDRVSAAFTPVTLLRGGGLLAGVGLATGILLGNPIAAIAGWACLGAGLSCIVPALYSAAGQLEPAKAGAVLSRVAAVGYRGYVTGPVIVGAAAARVGLGTALLILPVLATMLAFAAPVVRTQNENGEETQEQRG